MSYLAGKGIEIKFVGFDVHDSNSCMNVNIGSK